MDEEEEEAVSADGNPAEAPYEEEQEDVEEEKELEEPGPELEAPLEDVSGEPVESGTRLTTQGLPYALFVNNSSTTILLVGQNISLLIEYDVAVCIVLD